MSDKLVYIAKIDRLAMEKKMKSLRGKKVFFWWGAGHVTGVIFIRWARMRMGTGGNDTNKIGVGCIVKVFWKIKRENGLLAGQVKVYPYMDIYRTYRGAYERKGKIRRPKIKTISARRTKAMTH